MSIDNSALNNYIGNAAFSNGPATGRGSVSSASGNSWYEAMSRAWGSALDGQAAQITEMSDTIRGGADQPSNMVQLTAASLKMQFMSNNAATSQNATGQALETLGKRQ
ncbi:MAG: hypothetical protein GX538_01505 [Gammaproteobacteria bacterium]|nr:hypothetical protein [Gammaproteobacteria bacterium]